MTHTLRQIGDITYRERSRPRVRTSESISGLVAVDILSARHVDTRIGNTVMTIDGLLTLSAPDKVSAWVKLTFMLRDPCHVKFQCDFMWVDRFKLEITIHEYMENIHQWKISELEPKGHCEWFSLNQPISNMLFGKSNVPYLTTCPWPIPKTLPHLWRAGKTDVSNIVITAGLVHWSLVNFKDVLRRIVTIEYQINVSQTRTHGGGQAWISWGSVGGRIPKKTASVVVRSVRSPSPQTTSWVSHTRQGVHYAVSDASVNKSWGVVIADAPYDSIRTSHRS
uniref:Uncharacterized protein n=1 Tax=Timema tahoe TaxID=61484 RepID=A0A7R9P013_9NEOP|nr:unnamed protein product [Timema tahoe]